IAPDAVARVAALAPAVLRRGRAGDRAARRVVAEAQRALAALVVRAAPRLGTRRALPVSWAGGLLRDRRFRAGVWRALRRRGGAVAAVHPGATPATTRPRSS